MTAQAPIASQASSVHPPVHETLEAQRRFFATGATLPLEFRLEQLKKLKQAILDFQDDIVTAAKNDLGRPEFEAYFEMGIINEVSLAIKNLKSWMKPQRVATTLDQFPARAWTQSDPLGVVLIIGPWNYPFQLMISPLVGAIAAGNCAILKPSETAPHTSRVVANLIRSTFDPTYIAAIEGAVETSQALLAEKFDHIFFTGGTRIGKIIMEAAAKHLTPVTLELGGKSPCIVDPDINLTVAAKRIIWGKCINAGQTCIAPDYVLADRRIKPQLIEAMKQALVELYGEDPAASPDFARIINDHHFSRLTSLLGNGITVAGGKTRPSDRYIAPTILDGITWDDPVMREEIFGPILPVLDYDTIDEAIAQINARPKPLSLYLFTRNKHKQHQVLRHTSSGGVCLNDTVLQVAAWNLPFGGVGDSGIGAYHGKASFDTFSHQKSIFKKPFWLDATWRYAPYAKKLGLLKRVLGN